MDLPTLAHLRSYNTGHLVDAAAHWDGAAARWRNTWLSVEQETHGLDWEGSAREAAVARVAADHTVVKANAGALERAAGIAREQAGTLTSMARSVTHLADQATEDGYTVSDDYEVDFPPTPDLGTYIAKQTKAEEYSADLRYRAGNWAAHEHKTAADLIQAVDTSGATGSASPDGKVKCWDRGDGKTNCFEQLPDGGGFTWNDAPGGLNGEEFPDWPSSASTTTAGSGVQMVDSHTNSDGSINYTPAQHPPQIINNHGGQTPVPADPRDHNGTSREIVDGLIKVVTGGTAEAGGILAAPVTGGASLAGVPGGLLPIYDGLDDLSHLTNMGRLPDAPPVAGQDGPG